MAKLFSQIAFYIVVSKDLQETQALKLAEDLTSNGAEQIYPPVESGRINLDGITHIIATNIDFPSYETATTRMISVVKPSWVDSSLLKNKMANPRSHSPDPRQFFSGLMVYVADLPENDKNAIIGGLEAMGGIYAPNMSKQVTHIVALSTQAQACQLAISRNLACKIVLPHWFDDCLRLGSKIEEKPYQLPNPSILEPNGTAPAPKPIAKLIGYITAQNGDSSLQSSEGQRLTVFSERKIMLSKDLELTEHLSTTLSTIIKTGGGEVVDRISKADTLVCQYREGEDFLAAGRGDKTIGSLTWLYHLISLNAWKNPLSRLLDYPVVRDGLPGFKNYRISLSNYNGDARLYLENLAKAAGCEFTKSMKADNTHLITAHTMSEKCDAAKEWNIHMINHLWLEESYAKWQVQSVATPKYIHFPSKTNLSEIVGQTPIDKEVLRKLYFTAPAKADSEAETESEVGEAMEIDSKPVVRNSKRSKVVDDTIIDLKSDLPKSSPALSHRTKDTNSTPTPSRRNRKSGLTDDIQTPASRVSNAGKENETPSTGGRSAKAKAVANMQGYANDIARYEKERKRKGGVVHGGRTKDEIVPTIGSKRSASVESSLATGTEDEHKPKRAKKTGVEPKMRLLVTGHPKWSQDGKQWADDKTRIANLGIELTQDPTTCTVLAAPKIMRTKKFVIAMASCPVVVSTDFIDACLEQDQLLSTSDYPLRDSEGEKRYRTTIPKALKMAKQNSGRLLDGYIIYCTEHVSGDFATFKEIVEVNGGECILYKGRGSLKVKEGTDDHVYLISATTPADVKLWPKFRAAAEEIDRPARIAKTDWLLDLAIAQQVRWDRSYELSEDRLKEEEKKA